MLLFRPVLFHCSLINEIGPFFSFETTKTIKFHFHLLSKYTKSKFFRSLNINTRNKACNETLRKQIFPLAICLKHITFCPHLVCGLRPVVIYFELLIQALITGVSKKLMNEFHLLNQE